MFVAYADCGTGGAPRPLLAAIPGVARLPGAHCYEVFAGGEPFAALHDEELGTFYLTDFLARHFDALVWSGLGLDRHPELRDMYFGNYRRVVLLSQSTDPDVVVARRVAPPSGSGLAFVHRADRSRADSAAAVPRSPIRRVRRSMPRRARSEVVVISWRDIPGPGERASRRESTRCCCRAQFQRAIDDAAMAQARRRPTSTSASGAATSVPVAGDFEAVAGRRRRGGAARRRVPRRAARHARGQAAAGSADVEAG